MGILNIQKVPSWIILNIHEAKSWVFWIFMKWRHVHFECSKADVRCKYSLNALMGILNIQKLVSWTFWIFMNGILNTKWRYEADAMGIEYSFKITSFFENSYSYIPMNNEYSHDGTSWIFKIPMEYSNCTWRHFMHTQNTHDVSLISKIPMTSAWMN